MIECKNMAVKCDDRNDDRYFISIVLSIILTWNLNHIWSIYIFKCLLIMRCKKKANQLQIQWFDS